MIRKEDFGKAERFILSNSNRLEVSVLDYGATIQSVLTPDRSGSMGDIVLGFDNFKNYEAGHPYFGTVIGRFGNRIAKGRFTLDGSTYELACNNGGNHLHGGIEGFDKKFWQPRIVDGVLELSYTSPHMEEGYPGKLDLLVSYSLDDEDQLLISYEAKADQATILNLANHAYFNLAGSGEITEHLLMIHSDHITPVDANMIPTGEFREVAGGPFDFRKAKKIGQDIASSDKQIVIGGGYDHNFVLRNPGHQNLAAEVVEAKSGRTLQVYTDEPGVQLYTANFLEGNYDGKMGQNYGPRTGFCLETQHFPDSPNHSHFPSTKIEPGETSRSMTIYKFGVID